MVEPGLGCHMVLPLRPFKKYKKNTKQILAKHRNVPGNAAELRWTGYLDLLGLGKAHNKQVYKIQVDDGDDFNKKEQGENKTKYRELQV